MKRIIELTFLIRALDYISDIDENSIYAADVITDKLRHIMNSSKVSKSIMESYSEIKDVKFMSNNFLVDFFRKLEDYKIFSKEYECDAYSFVVYSIGIDSIESEYELKNKLGNSVKEIILEEITKDSTINNIIKIDNVSSKFDTNILFDIKNDLDNILRTKFKIAVTE